MKSRSALAALAASALSFALILVGGFALADPGGPATPKLRLAVAGASVVLPVVASVGYFAERLEDRLADHLEHAEAITRLRISAASVVHPAASPPTPRPADAFLSRPMPAFDDDPVPPSNDDHRWADDGGAAFERSTAAAATRDFRRSVTCMRATHPG